MKIFDVEVCVLTDVLDFLKEVESKTKGYTVYLGGGYLRDIYYNRKHYVAPFQWEWREPKDIDLFFIPNGEMVKELPVIPRTYINYDIDAKDIQHCRPNVASVRGIFNRNLSTTDIQFIVYDKSMSMRQLAEDMDCNVNGIMYDIKANLTYMTDAFTNSHEDKVIEMLHDFEPQRMYNRLKRMQKKFPDYELKYNKVVLDWDHFENTITTEGDSIDVGGTGSGTVKRADGSFIKD